MRVECRPRKRNHVNHEVRIQHRRETNKIPRMMVKRDVRMVAAQNRNEDNPPRREWSESPRQTQAYDIAGALLALETFKITLDHGS